MAQRHAGKAQQSFSRAKLHFEVVALPLGFSFSSTALRCTLCISSQNSVKTPELLLLYLLHYLRLKIAILI